METPGVRVGDTAPGLLVQHINPLRAEEICAPINLSSIRLPDNQKQLTDTDNARDCFKCSADITSISCNIAGKVFIGPSFFPSFSIPDMLTILHA